MKWKPSGLYGLYLDYIRIIYRGYVRVILGLYGDKIT